MLSACQTYYLSQKKYLLKNSFMLKTESIRVGRLKNLVLPTNIIFFTHKDVIIFFILTVLS